MPTAVPASASHPGAPPRPPRMNIFLTATLSVGGMVRPVRVRNLSAAGALVEGALLPETGNAAILQRGSLSADCTIVWQSGGRGGLHFASPIDMANWIPGWSPEAEAEIDRPLAVAPSASARDCEAPAAIEPGLLRRAADELAFVSRRLEALGNDLTDDIHVVMRHTTSLQELDISMQILGHLAAVLVAKRPADAVDAIGMTDLRRRLQRKSLL